MRHKATGLCSKNGLRTHRSSGGPFRVVLDLHLLSRLFVKLRARRGSRNLAPLAGVSGTIVLHIRVIALGPSGAPLPRVCSKPAGRRRLGCADCGSAWRLAPRSSLRSSRRKPRRAGAAGAPVAVDAAIVLAADVSRSIDEDEFALQRRGYADAIQSQQLLDAVSTGPHGAIALAYVEWAGDGEDKVVVDWAVIRNQTDAQAFAAALTAAPRSLRRPDGHRHGDRFLVRDVRRERVFDRPQGDRRLGRRHQQPGPPW